MASSGSPTSKSGCRLLVLGLLGAAVVLVMGLLAYLLLTFPRPASRIRPTSTRTLLNLPTAAPSTPAGPPMPVEASFAAKEPIAGFSDCELYGFKGTVTDSHGAGLAGIQVVVWGEPGLLALGTTRADGTYLIKIQDKPDQPQLWLQLYRDDRPVSNPLPVEAHIDCHQGFQLYQINWQELAGDHPASK